MRKADGWSNTSVQPTIFRIKNGREVKLFAARIISNYANRAAKVDKFEIQR
tara:strand:+ start:1283 stop:1435 length:153 start_codon:yes stop_codon:yes gene_type:complete